MKNSTCHKIFCAVVICLALQILVVGMGVSAAPRVEVGFSQESEEDGTGFAQRRAVFAAFLATQRTLDTAISVSNTLAAPPGIVEYLAPQSAKSEGTLEFFFWDSEGHLIYYETDPVAPGSGLSPDGTLEPGRTYRVLLSELLEAAAYSRHAQSAGHDEEIFAGYAWIVANFGGVQGVVSVTDFSSFTQTLAMQPDLGSAIFSFGGGAGAPIDSLPRP